MEIPSAFPLSFFRRLRAVLSVVAEFRVHCTHSGLGFAAGSVIDECLCKIPSLRNGPRFTGGKFNIIQFPPLTFVRGTNALPRRDLTKVRESLIAITVSLLRSAGNENVTGLIYTHRAVIDGASAAPATNSQLERHDALVSSSNLSRDGN